MKKLAVGSVVALCALFLAPSLAFANPTLPTSQTWTNSPLQEMLRVSGKISLSISGSGFLTRTGSIKVEKPANATVIGAYLTSAVSWDITAPPEVTISNQPVTFTHHAKMTVGTFGNKFTNHFADVTPLVKSTIDAHSAGIFTLPLDEGSGFAETSLTDGEELVVIFDDPAKAPSSAIIMFGASKPSGDSFTVNFPALTNLNSQKATFSLGISYSKQPSTPFQHSDVDLSTSSNSSLQPVSRTAGGRDDGYYPGNTVPDGALITVGGVGDSDALPGLTPTSDDDELYNLNSFLQAGDTAITIATQNATGDDNIFQAVFYFEGVEVTGAVNVVGTSTTSNSSNPASNEEASLAATGSHNNLLFAYSVVAAVTLIVLGGIMVATRRLAKK